MQQTFRNKEGADHLRVVFAETVVRLDLGRNATLLDVARTLRPDLRQRYGKPRDIRVVLDRTTASRPSFITRSV